MKIQRQIAANEAHLAGIDVILLQLHKCIRVELATERALVIGKLHYSDRRVVAAERIPSRSHTHLDLIGHRRLLGPYCRLLTFEKLMDRLEFLEHFIRLVLAHTLWHIDGDGVGLNRLGFLRAWLGSLRESRN